MTVEDGAGAPMELSAARVSWTCARESRVAEASSLGVLAAAAIGLIHPHLHVGLRIDGEYWTLLPSWC